MKKMENLNRSVTSKEMESQQRKVQDHMASVVPPNIYKRMSDNPFQTHPKK